MKKHVTNCLKWLFNRLLICLDRVIIWSGHKLPYEATHQADYLYKLRRSVKFEQALTEEWDRQMRKSIAIWKREMKKLYARKH